MYPACVPGIRARIVTLASGVGLRVVEAGRKIGTPLILIHGWGACVYTFRYQLRDLEASGRRLIAFDQRGHGLSDKPVSRGSYATNALVEDLRELMDALQIDRADLLGHSLGGGVALHFTLAHRARVRRLVLAAPIGLTSMALPAIGHLLTPRFTDRFARFLTPRLLTEFLLRSTYGNPRRVTELDIDEYWAPSQFPDYYRAARALLEEFDWNALSSRQLASLDHSSLVILSTADRLIRGAEPAATTIPKSKLVQLEGAGHLGVEECAQEFNRALMAFLDPS
ncbi:MAG TPA: alpha/beta hydrolase [Gemmatimonadaceae bacterium]|jgi:pimeloyl-ACP methyl ester carboxylesterase